MFGLDDQTLETILGCLKQFPDIEEVRVYGSRAMGNYHPGSDIDLAVYSDTAVLQSRLYAALDNLPLPYKFDVTDYHRLTHQPLRDHIDRVGQTLYKSQATT